MRWGGVVSPSLLGWDYAELPGYVQGLVAVHLLHAPIGRETKADLSVKHPAAHRACFVLWHNLGWDAASLWRWVFDSGCVAALSHNALCLPVGAVWLWRTCLAI